MVKNMPATLETRKSPLEEDMATYSSILAGESQGQRSLVGDIQPVGSQSREWLSN